MTHNGVGTICIENATGMPPDQDSVFPGKTALECFPKSPPVAESQRQTARIPLWHGRETSQNKWRAGGVNSLIFWIMKSFMYQWVYAHRSPNRTGPWAYLRRRHPAALATPIPYTLRVTHEWLLHRK